MFKSMLLLLLAMGARSVTIPPVSGLPSADDRLYARTQDACVKLSDAFPDDVFLPESTAYEEESTAIWSKACVLAPSCVFLPDSAQDLSTGLGIIRGARSRFAVRSGGHMPVPGAQSVDNGVMISMSRFNTRALRDDGAVASIGPGQTWGEVYDWLAPSGLALNGGRFPSVGVGGLLIGGGIGYFSGAEGWSCDSVVGFEVVLANGSVVEVTADQHSDLGWALRGGHNNLGIVTRFDMRTLPATTAFGGLTVWAGSAVNEFLDAIGDFMTPGEGGVDDSKAAVNAFVTVEPGAGAASLQASNAALYIGSDSNPEALRGFTNIDAAHILAGGSDLHESWADIPRQLAPFESREQRTLFWSVSFKGHPRAISIHNETVVGGALRDLKDLQGVTIHAVWQPISKKWLEKSRQVGGNVLDLDPEQYGSFVAGTIMAFWNDEADDEAVYSFVSKAADEVSSRTQELGLGLPFVYLNDAAKPQRPFETYGAGGSSLRRLKDVRKKYDPDGFFQHYLQHGFGL